MTPALCILGTGTFRGDPLPEGRPGALVRALAGEPRGLGAGRLVDEIWAHDPPANPLKALAVVASRVRAALGADVLERTPTGYRLTLTDDDVDLRVVGRQADRAEAALRDGDLTGAEQLAAEALALWAEASDPTLTEQAPLRARLTRVQALVQSATGRHEEALPALTALLEVDGSDEKLRAAQLRAVAATQGETAALVAYEAYRHTLRDDLGADPGRELQALHSDLLGGAVRVRSGVRHDPNTLLGRDEDLDAVARLLRTSRVTSIVGPGGLGKTRMAHAASLQADEPAVHFVELAAVSTDAGVVPEVANVLGARDARLRLRATGQLPADVHQRMAEVLGATPSLLVLDNCEHVIDGAARLVDELSARVPGLRVLTTTRAPLEIAAEQVYLLPQLDRTTSIELFVQRARSTRPDADLDLEVVGRIVDRLDGLPLAVELAAARARVMSVQEIERRLADRFALLRGANRSAPARHQTLEAVIDWSWNLLGGPEQTALAWLSTFRDGFSTEAASAVVGAKGEAAVETLVAQSLLTVTDTTDGTRYRMLETVREFALARLAASGEQPLARAALRAWAAAYAALWAVELLGPQLPLAASRVRAEEANLEEVLQGAVEDRDDATLVPVFAALAALWSFESNHLRVLRMLPVIDYALYAARPPAEAAQLHRLALAIVGGSSSLISIRRAIRSLSRLRRMPPGDPETLPGALSELLVRTLGAPPGDVAILEEIGRSPHPLLAAIANALASQLWENRADPDRALAFATLALQMRKAHTNPWVSASGHGRLAEILLQQEQVTQAEEQANLALPMLEQIGAWPDVAQLRGVLVMAAIQRGELDRAEDLLPRAVSRGGRDEGFGISVTGPLLRAELDLAQGRTSEGLASYRHAAQQAQAPIEGIEAQEARGLEPWTLHTEGACLAVHALNDGLDDVTLLEESLAGKLERSIDGVPLGEVDLPICGLVLLGIGLAAVARAPGDPAARRFATSAVALAMRLNYNRSYPSISRARVEAPIRETSSAAYDRDVRRYAALEAEDLLAEVRAVLALRPVR